MRNDGICRAGEVLDIFTNPERLRQALAGGFGEAWIVMHSYYAKSGTADADLSDLRRHEKVEQAAPAILSDNKFSGPLLMLEDSVDEARAAKGLAELAGRTGKSVFLNFTDSGNKPLLPKQWAPKDGMAWRAYIEYLRRQGLNRARVAGMFYRKDKSGCVGDLVKALEDSGIEVEVSDFITPAQKADFST